MTREEAEVLKVQGERIRECVLTYEDKDNVVFERYTCRNSLIHEENDDYKPVIEIISSKGLIEYVDTQKMLDIFIR